ncbi:MAG: acyl carrier protein [Nitrospirae bacterium]|nr:MAG: acyl carrier protein [Nitrospirota bacterium]
MTVKELVGKVFKINPQDLSDASSRDTIEQWDSMGHLALITALEEHFQVNISIADAMEMTNIRKIKDVLQEYGVSGESYSVRL